MGNNYDLQLTRALLNRAPSVILILKAEKLVAKWVALGVSQKVLHGLHRPSTEHSKENPAPQRKDASLVRSPSAIESLRKLVEQPVQILVRLPLLIDLADGVHDGGMVLAAKLPADLRQ